MSSTWIQGVRVHQYGGPEQLRVERIERQEPQPGEVLVRVMSAGVLPIDWKVRLGLFQRFRSISFPYIPGSAIAGVVEEVGPEVTRFQAGDAVFGRSEKGAYTEFTTTSEETIAHKPASLSFDEAATLSGGATTAWQALFRHGDVKAGDRVLVHGAAGGVGLFAVQFAKWKGAHVIGTASAGNVEFVRSLGADEVVDYTSAPFEHLVHDVDLALDTVGGDTLERTWSVVRRGGKLITIAGQPSAEKAREHDIRAMFSNELPTADVMQSIARLIEEGRVRPHVACTFPLGEAPQAHERSQTGHGRGRIVLHIAD